MESISDGKRRYDCRSISTKLRENAYFMLLFAKVWEICVYIEEVVVFTFSSLQPIAQTPLHCRMVRVGFCEFSKPWTFASNNMYSLIWFSCWASIVCVLGSPATFLMFVACSDAIISLRRTHSSPWRGALWRSYTHGVDVVMWHVSTCLSAATCVGGKRSSRMGWLALNTKRRKEETAWWTL